MNRGGRRWIHDRLKTNQRLATGLPLEDGFPMDDLDNNSNVQQRWLKIEDGTTTTEHDEGNQI